MNSSRQLPYLKLFTRELLVLYHSLGVSRGSILLENAIKGKIVVLSNNETLPKTNLKRVTSYIEPELYESLEKLAKSDRRTISQMIGVLIENAVLKAKEEGRINDQ